MAIPRSSRPARSRRPEPDAPSAAATRRRGRAPFASSPLLALAAAVSLSTAGCSTLFGPTSQEREAIETTERELAAAGIAGAEVEADCGGHWDPASVDGPCRIEISLEEADERVLERLASIDALDRAYATVRYRGVAYETRAGEAGAIPALAAALPPSLDVSEPVRLFDGAVDATIVPTATGAAGAMSDVCAGARGVADAVDRATVRARPAEEPVRLAVTTETGTETDADDLRAVEHRAACGLAGALLGSGPDVELARVEVELAPRSGQAPAPGQSADVVSAVSVEVRRSSDPEGDVALVAAWLGDAANNPDGIRFRVSASAD